MTDQSSQTENERMLRELALTDRIIGLEAEVARLNVQAGLNDIRVLHRSLPYRVGRIVLAPYTVLRRVLGK